MLSDSCHHADAVALCAEVVATVDHDIAIAADDVDVLDAKVSFHADHALNGAVDLNTVTNSADMDAGDVLLALGY